MELVLGFTGTQSGMTGSQAASVARLQSQFKKGGYTKFHHGMCIGADDQANETAGWMGYKRYGHPGHDKEGNSPKKADCEVDVEYEAKPYPTRNQDIVDRIDRLIAAPQYPEDDPRSKRSGTWATVRMARKREVSIIIDIVWPDGEITTEVAA